MLAFVGSVLLRRYSFACAGVPLCLFVIRRESCACVGVGCVCYKDRILCSGGSISAHVFLLA